VLPKIWRHLCNKVIWNWNYQKKWFWIDVLQWFFWKDLDVLLFIKFTLNVQISWYLWLLCHLIITYVKKCSKYEKLSTGTPPLTRIFGSRKNCFKEKPHYRRSILVLKPKYGEYESSKSTFWAKVGYIIST